jgi:hypothetical protein
MFAGVCGVVGRQLFQDQTGFEVKEPGSSVEIPRQWLVRPTMTNICKECLRRIFNKERRKAGNESPSDSCLSAFLIHSLFTISRGL